MRRTLFLLTLLLNIIASIAQTHHVILIDNSGSMRGRPLYSGNLDIWEPTKRSITEYIDQIGFNNTVTLFSFDSHLSEGYTIKLSDANKKEHAKNEVKDLTASGGNTCLFTSLRTALQQLNDDKIKYDRVIFYVFTDLVQACAGEPFDIMDIIREYNLAKSLDLANLYYISLGKAIPKEIVEWGREDSTVIAISKNPVIEDIFPEISLVQTVIEVNFSNNRFQSVAIPFESSTRLDNKTFDLNFVSKNQNIRLIDSIGLVENNIMRLNFQLQDKHYSNEKSSGVLYLGGGDNIDLKNDKIELNFILPKRGSITVKIK